MNQNFFKYGYIKSLIPFFYPEHIAILNTENDVAKQIFKNLFELSFNGYIYPINKTNDRFLGMKCYYSLDEIPGTIDLVIITENYPEAFSCIQECIRNKNKIKAILMVSTGFREDSKVYDSLKNDFLSVLRENNIRLIGPNSIGYITPYTNLNVSIFPKQIKKGNIAFITQSGTIGSAILDWSISRNIGFSAFINVGSSIDVNIGELIDYFGHDVNTRSIIIYLETLRYPKNFFSAAREISLTKPIIVLKSGINLLSRNIIKQRSGYPIKDEILNAGFRRSGILRVESVEELFYMAEILSEQEIPQNHHLAILSYGTGPLLLAVDKYLQLGGKIQPFSTNIQENIKKTTHLKLVENPLSLNLNTSIDDLIKIISIIEKDPEQSGILLIITSNFPIDYELLCNQIIELKSKLTKPFLVCLMGGNSIVPYMELLRKYHIPTFEHPDIAVKVFYYMYKYYYSIKSLYETPYEINTNSFDYIKILEFFNKIDEKQNNQSVVLNAEESLELLSYAKFKINLNTKYNQLVNIGCYIEPIVGPVLFFRVLSSSIPIVNYGLPPLNTVLAKRMIENARNYEFLKHRKNIISILEILLVQLSNFILEFPRIQYISIYVNIFDFNYDIYKARIKIFYSEEFLKKYIPPVIRPYPKQYIEPYVLKNNSKIIIRPIKPEDEPLIIKFHYDLSEQSVYLRYLQPLDLKHRITHERMIKICFLDYDREIAIVAYDPEKHQILGVGRLSHHPYLKESEYAILIADRYQGMGLGKKLLSSLIEIGRREGRKTIYGIVLKNNVSMIKVCEKLGFTIKDIDEELVKVEIEL